MDTGGPGRCAAPSKSECFAVARPAELVTPAGESGPLQRLPGRLGPGGQGCALRRPVPSAGPGARASASRSSQPQRGSRGPAPPGGTAETQPAEKEPEGGGPACGNKGVAMATREESALLLEGGQSGARRPERDAEGRLVATAMTGHRCVLCGPGLAWRAGALPAPHPWEPPPGPGCSTRSTGAHPGLQVGGRLVYRPWSCSPSSAWHLAPGLVAAFPSWGEEVRLAPAREHLSGSQSQRVNPPGLRRRKGLGGGKPGLGPA